MINTARGAKVRDSGLKMEAGFGLGEENLQTQTKGALNPKPQTLNPKP